MTETTPIIVITTCATQEEANRISLELISKRLAACVQHSQITSEYLWENQIEKNQEFKLEMKTLSHLFDKITEHVQAISSYDCPEIIALPILKIHRPYEAWLHQCLSAELFISK